MKNGKRMTQEKMAMTLDITVAHYKAIEYGQRNPSLQLMQKIKKLFPKFSVDYIFLQ
jgi:DNA-binding XRE family transcriptional regulator